MINAIFALLKMHKLNTACTEWNQDLESAACQGPQMTVLKINISVPTNCQLLFHTINMRSAPLTQGNVAAREELYLQNKLIKQ